MNTINTFLYFLYNFSRIFSEASFKQLPHSSNKKTRNNSTKSIYAIPNIQIVPRKSGEEVDPYAVTVSIKHNEAR